MDLEQAFDRYVGFLQFVCLRLFYVTVTNRVIPEVAFPQAWSEALRPFGGNEGYQGRWYLKAGQILDEAGLVDELHKAVIEHFRAGRDWRDFKPDFAAMCSRAGI
jgi:hypothetical protein